MNGIFMSGWSTNPSLNERRVYGKIILLPFFRLSCRMFPILSFSLSSFFFLCIKLDYYLTGILCRGYLVIAIENTM